MSRDQLIRYITGVMSNQPPGISITQGYGGSVSVVGQNGGQTCTPKAVASATLNGSQPRPVLVTPLGRMTQSAVPQQGHELPSHVTATSKVDKVLLKAGGVQG